MCHFSLTHWANSYARTCSPPIRRRSRQRPICHWKRWPDAFTRRCALRARVRIFLSPPNRIFLMALMFPRLARNFANNGYYPTDEAQLERTLNALVRLEEHTSELHSLMPSSFAFFRLQNI